MGTPRHGWGTHTLCVGLLFVAGTALGTPAPAVARAPELVWLKTIAPSIVEEIRYAGSFNFTGAPLPGYQAPRCWLSRPAAQALARADAALAPFGVGLKVYDCYRPVRATLAMLAWSRQATPLSAAENFFLAGLGRPQAFALGYVARRSAHQRGSTIDCTLIARGAAPEPLDGAPGGAASCLQAPPLEQNGVFLGTAYDCFDARSATKSMHVPANARALRALLHASMRQAGFVNYPKEWWHYTLRDEPYPHTAIDVPITR